MSELFVCNGNVSRSQVAETMLHLSHHGARSAGTAVRDLDAEGQTLRARADNPTTSVTSGFVLELMLKKGFDLSGNVLKQVTPEMVEASDRVVLMRGRIPPEDFLAWSDKVAVWDIADPLDTSSESTALIIDQAVRWPRRTRAHYLQKPSTDWKVYGRPCEW